MRVLLVKQILKSKEKCREVWLRNVLYVLEWKLWERILKAKLEKKIKKFWKVELLSWKW